MVFSNLLKHVGIGVATVALLSVGLVNASGEDLDTQTLERLEQTIQLQQRQLEELRQEIEQLKEMATMADSQAKQAQSTADMAMAAKKDKEYGVTVYGSLRPALTHSDFGKSSSTDVTDFLSRVGVKGEVVVSDSLTAFYRGEWDVDIEDDADFGDARLGYVGIKGRAGQIAIGKQWNPHFNIVAEVTDIFNHRSSPFGYDEASPFRTPQMLTYSYSQGGFRLDSGIQFDGDPEESAGGGNSTASEPDHIDSASLGIGYGMGDFYAGISYLDQQGGSDYERSFLGLAASWNVTDDFYLAVTYQDIDADNVGEDVERTDADGNVVMEYTSHSHDESDINTIIPEGGKPVYDTVYSDYDQSSFDLAASLALGGGYKLKAAYFDWDGDGNGRSFDGYNLTIENQISDSVRIFAEWLRRDIERGEEQDHLSIGLRYDFEANL